MLDWSNIVKVLPGQRKDAVLARQIKAALRPGMTLPPALEQLFGWIEARGQFIDNPTGRVGYLSTPQRSVGTYIEFSATDNACLEAWFGTSDPTIIARLCVFARTGMDGSMAAFWLDDTGRQTIVHLGSGSGSTTVCTLADDPIDFLRLLAIGYDEICWSDAYTAPPEGDDQSRRQRDRRFATWVAQTFDVTIPDHGAIIVPNPASMLDTTSDDTFWQWVQRHTAY